MSAQTGFAALVPRLIEQARKLAEARTSEIRLGQTDRAARWRHAALLWPLFTKG